jgi:hypothetical protein
MVVEWLAVEVGLFVGCRQVERLLLGEKGLHKREGCVFDSASNGCEALSTFHSSNTAMRSRACQVSFIHKPRLFNVRDPRKGK